MADEDSVQPVSQPSAPAAEPSSMVSAPSFGGGDPKPSNANAYEESTDLDDGPEEEGEKKEFTDIFDFLVGITPGRVVDLVGGAAMGTLETVMCTGMDSVRGMIKGGGEASKAPAQSVPSKPAKGPRR